MLVPKEFLYHLTPFFPKPSKPVAKSPFWKKRTPELEQMLTVPISPPKRNYADDQMLAATPSLDLLMCREMALT